MSPRQTGRSQACDRRQVRTRLNQARAFLEVAELVGTEQNEVASNGQAMARDLARLLSITDDAHYGLLHVGRSRAAAALRQARRLVDTAAAHVE